MGESPAGHSINLDHDIYHLDNYDKLADALLMYGQPDTAFHHGGGAQVQIGVYSPNGVIQAAAVRDNIKDLLHAQELYLGGKLPVENMLSFLLHRYFRCIRRHGCIGTHEFQCVLSSGDATP